jgi:hypothetical protein
MRGAIYGYLPKHNLLDRSIVRGSAGLFRPVTERKKSPAGECGGVELVPEGVSVGGWLLQAVNSPRQGYAHIKKPGHVLATTMPCRDDRN